MPGAQTSCHEARVQVTGQIGDCAMRVEAMVASTHCWASASHSRPSCTISDRACSRRGAAGMASACASSASASASEGCSGGSDAAASASAARAAACSRSRHG